MSFLTHVLVGLELASRTKALEESTGLAAWSAIRDGRKMRVARAQFRRHIRNRSPLMSPVRVHFRTPALATVTSAYPMNGRHRSDPFRRAISQLIVAAERGVIALQNVATVWRV
jgi:hypothetical protein